MLPCVVLNLPVSTLVLVSFFQSIPKDLETAAMIDGCTRMGALWRHEARECQKPVLWATRAEWYRGSSSALQYYCLGAILNS